MNGKVLSEYWLQVAGCKLIKNPEAANATSGWCDQSIHRKNITNQLPDCLLPNACHCIRESAEQRSMAPEI